MEKSLARQKNLPEDVSRYLKDFIMKEQKFKGGKKNEKTSYKRPQTKKINQ